MTRWTEAQLASLVKRGLAKPQKRAISRPSAPRRHPKTEDALAQQMSLLGLPLPQRQYKFAAPERKFRADFCWPDRKLIIEVEGQAHSIRAQREADIARRQWCHFHGWTVLSVSSKQVRSGEAIEIVRKALQA